MSDIRTREDVLRVYKKMGGTIHNQWGWDMIPFHFGVGDIAFFMRDKCDKNRWFAELKTLCKPESWPQIMLEYTTPEKWIEAAVKAWDGRAADAGDES